MHRSAAKIYNFRSCRLTSEVIQTTSNGMYTFEDAVMLLLHESLRREISRTNKALANFSPKSLRDWQIAYMIDWIKGYLLPALTMHEKNEDEFIWPNYQNFGILVPAELHKDHDLINEKLRELSTITDALESCDEDAKLRELVVNLKSTFDSLSTTLKRHYAQEEKFWPKFIAEHGKDAYRDAMHKCLKTNMSRGVGRLRSTHYFIAAYFDAIGYTIRGQNRVEYDENDIPWCSPAMCDLIISNQSIYLRTFPLPGWLSQYQQLKSKIQSVAIGNDLLQEILVMLHQKRGCGGVSCVIS